jgi:transposase-like protein
LEGDTFKAFCRRFDTEESCTAAFFAVRWPHGFRCPFCGHGHAHTIRTRRLPLYECGSCRSQVSLTSGTILEGSRTPLHKWFQSIFLLSRPAGITALALAGVICVTYKTAWLILHKLRHAMSQADAHTPLTGIVRMTASFYGKPHNPTIYLHPREHSILVGATLDSDLAPAYIKIKQVELEHLKERMVSRRGTEAFMERHVDPATADVLSEIRTYKRTNACFRTLSDLCKSAGRWLNAAFHGIGPKHLQAYFDEYCYRWNLSSSKLPIFANVLDLCVSTKVITYPVLVRRHKVSPLYTSIKRAA